MFDGDTMREVKVSDLTTIAAGTKLHVVTTKSGRPRVKGNAKVVANDGKTIEYVYETGADTGSLYEFRIELASMGLTPDDIASEDIDSYRTVMFFV